MASLAMKVQAEVRMRELLEKEGIPPPDEIEYGFGCIRLFWNHSKTVVVIDIDDDVELDETGLDDIDDAEFDETGLHDIDDAELDEADLGDIDDEDDDETKPGEPRG
jgi:hypothetical protein